MKRRKKNHQDRGKTDESRAIYRYEQFIALLPNVITIDNIHDQHEIYKFRKRPQ